ncbi:MAG TPA: type II toxin-antitoxin system RelE/ParE family toxin [Candidatus Angelobacter sp.]|nr:type II toxin-antitoxin system RelE/ParE family toxin [Candidatus Angelobacter sp.]
MIRTFRCKDTERLHLRESSVRFRSIERTAQRKLRQLHSAVVLHDMSSPPGNHLEALQGDRRGQHSVRINDQWRLCFRWDNGDAYEVEIVDYHS